MKKNILFPVLLGLTLLSATQAVGQMGGDFEITKSTIDGGGGTSSGGDFSLTGTIGQPDAGAQVALGGTFALQGGFWANAITDTLLKDGFEGP